MIINVVSTEKVEDGKFKIVAKEGEFYSKENGIQAGVYDVDTKPMVFKGQQVQVITSISPVQAKSTNGTQKASPVSGSDDRMTKSDWAQKDRAIVKQSVIKAIMGSPGLSMIAATKSEDEVGNLYDKMFKRMMKSFDEVE